MADPILATKLTAPTLPPGLLSRTRLVRKLSECTRHRLTVLAAPAGSGKTTLLAEWRATPAAQQAAVAWLSIGPADDEPERFFRCVAAALGAAMPGAGSQVAALLDASPKASPEAIAASLYRDLAQLTRELVLVLDDYHLIQSTSIHDALALALCRLPARAHVVVAARASPLLPLARLRTQGELLEIRSADLRFTVEEATSFLEGPAGLRLAPGFAEAVAARTEGWGAGLKLAALSAQGREDPESLLAAFTGAQRLVLDYLNEEVLEREPPEVQAFLLRTSILERFSGPLCDALAPGASSSRQRRVGARHGDGEGQRMLERLERQNLFLVPLDEERRWWRFHRLFGEFLRRRLEEERPGELDELHRRAALWLENDGSCAEAAGHAVEVREFQRAARLLEQAGFACLGTTRPSALLRWLRALPEAIARSRPDLHVMEAWALFQSGQLAAADARLQDATEAAPGDLSLRGQVDVLRGYAGAIRGEGRRATRLASSALRLLPRGASEKRVLAYLTLGLGHDCLGSSEAAQDDYRHAQALARVGDGLPWLYSTALLGDTALFRGELREAALLYEEALRLAPWGGEWAPAPAAMPHARLGALAYEWNDLDSAARHIDAAMTVGSRSETSDFAIVAAMQLAHVRQSQGDPPAARRLAVRAEMLLRDGALVSTYSVNLARALQARLWLRQGDVESAKRWAEAHGKGAPGAFQEDRHAGNATYVRALISLERLDEVAEPLRRWLRAARTAGREGFALELELLLALALAARGEAAAARSTLEKALDRARPEGWVRLFLDEGEPMVRLLECAARGRSPAAVYAQGLLATVGHCTHRSACCQMPSGAGAGGSLVEPLSRRELEILSFIADGLSNPEIAARSSVTVATVKTHINNLYGKLGARSRTDALVRARRLGLVQESGLETT